jgi:hypothetical protein
METPLVVGKALAEALGVSGAAVSTAAKEGRPCAGEPVHHWVRREGGRAARAYAVPEAKRKEYGIVPFDEETGSAEDVSAESSFGEDVAGAGANWAADIDADDIDRLARRLTAAIGARVATSLYEEMGPWLKAAIRAGAETGRAETGRAETGREEAAEEGGATEEPPSGPGGEGSSDFLRLIVSGSANDLGSRPTDNVQPEGETTTSKDAEAGEETPWRERLLRGLVEEGGLERVEGGGPPALSEGEEEKSFAYWLRVYGEARRRLAVEEGRIADAEGEARESLYRLLTSKEPLG